ncbi:MAG: 3-dehydroquinate synthase, partial [Desulfamplus sp.]|nr:3-dehydroquinate synthase [Desulfamplus sp.]
EAGERKKLNFGHTLGHALEKLKPIGHGRAVSIGMAAAALFSLKKGLLNQSEVNRIKIALKSMHLPVDFKEFNDNTNIIFDELLSAMNKDKKKDNDKISFVFLNGIGNAVVEKITFEELKSLLLNL